MNVQVLKRLERKVYEYENNVNEALEDLSKEVSLVLGYEVVADLCSGGYEIEFRTVSDNGRTDTDSCIRMEDVIAKLQKT